MTFLNELQQMRSYFDTGVTKDYEFRIARLKDLKQAVEKHEEALYQALFTDLKKSPEECWVTENGFFLSELNSAIQHLKHWMRPEKVSTNLLNFPSSSSIVPEPLGVVLIIGPWNYPFQLLFTPLIGAMAAGNCAVLKSSEFAPATSAVMKQIIGSAFDKQYILFTEGDGATVVPAMMNHFRFDHVFYTGSTVVGKIIYEMAARQLVPVTLELGGKSPCVIESDANITVAARRIALAKFSNAGQMCVAPDYLLLHASIKDKFLEALKKILAGFYGDAPSPGKEYSKIINEKQFNRLAGYLRQADVLYGGRQDSQQLYIQPTVVAIRDASDPIMQEEIFGPILPVITFNTPEEALSVIAANKDPLAFYVFTESSQQEKFWTRQVAFGGGCVNNASFHLTNHHLPFGGRGNSGLGQYHGKFSFKTFSHLKSIMRTPTWFDPSLKYPPYKGKMKLLKWIIR